MPSLLQAFLLLALVSFALAVPAPASRIQKRSFKVERIPNPNYVPKPGAGTRALIKAYNKFTVPLPPGLLDAMNAAQGAAQSLEGGTSQSNSNGKAKGQGSGGGNGATKGTGVTTGNSTGTTAGAATTGSAGSVQNVPIGGDAEYISPVTIGGQTMNMDFDSGSSDLWVFNTQLSAAASAGHTNFNPTQSKTFKLLKGATFDISYGDGSGAAGNVGTDTVNIGGATVTSQAVELATDVSQSFTQDTQSNGLVGLAFSKLNTVQPNAQKTFFDNAIATLPEPVFTADLKHAAPGTYEFGAIDSSKFTGSLSWTSINASTGFWQFPSNKFAVGNGKAQTLNDGFQAIADTGTTLMLVDPTTVNAYYSQVSGAANNATLGGVTFPCNADLPDLSVAVGDNYMAVVKGEFINFAPVDATNTTCFGGVQATPTNLQIYGDILFKSQFVAFNGQNKSIAMAPKS